MSRSGYEEDNDGWDLISWRGAVSSAIHGKRGQAFLKEMLEALDAMPEKSLITNDLELNGEVCAMGAVGVKRGMDMKEIDPEERYEVAIAFGISGALAAEIAYENDEGGWKETPQERWARMRNWTALHILGKRNGK